MKIDNFEVRPCPFCGSESLRLRNGSNLSWVFCRNCTSIGPSCENAEEAVKRWNSAYPALDANFVGVWLERWLKDQDKNVCHAGDIREIITLLLTLKTDIEHVTQRINAILSIGWPGNEDQ